jgi:hypothetical protein
VSVCVIDPGPRNNRQRRLIQALQQCDMPYYLSYQVHGSTEPVLYTLILLGLVGGPSRIRTYDFHRVKVALYR